MHTQRVATCRPRREASEETNPAGIMTVAFQPPEWGADTLLVCESPHRGVLGQPQQTNTMTYGGIQAKRVARLKC